MRITNISVEGLFGIFNHEVPLNLDDRITIIHGPNGLGKTVLLTMINSLFAGRFSIFRTIPFNTFSVAFDDGRRLSLSRATQSVHLDEGPAQPVENLMVELLSRSEPRQSSMIELQKDTRMQFPLDALGHFIPELGRIGPSTWIYYPTQETLSMDEVLDRFADRLPAEMRPRETQPDWLAQIRANVNIKFIETQRLLAYAKGRRVREFDTGTSMIPAVRNYSEELADMIQAKLAEYATLSQSLDRSFPARLVKNAGNVSRSIDELRMDLNALEDKRERLEVAGLLDKEEEIGFREFLNIDPGNISVLSVYIEDVKRKLSVFDELTNKIDLLIKIVNGRFLYKEMSIGKRDGFVFKTSDGRRVPIANLSSGEQHELVLFYELLFKVKRDSLILIDEPELSLHVVWQQQFLSDMEEITKLSGFDILIATHSPQIIHDRWDLTVQLKGPQDA